MTTDTEIAELLAHKRYSIAQDLGKKGGVKGVDNSIRALDGQREKFYSKLKEKATPPEGRLAECAADLQRSLASWHEDIGVTNVPIPPNNIEVYLTDDNDLLQGDNLGVETHNVAIARRTIDLDFIFEHQPPKDDETRQQVLDYVVMLNTAHELYHATAPDKYTMLFDDSGTRVTEVARERGGMVYVPIHERDGRRHGGKAYEEGLAVISENRQSAVLDQHFPLAADYFVQLRELAVKKGMYELSDGDIDVYPTRYVESARMIVTLHNLMRDAGYEIERLEEEARLQHKTLQLARAIDKICGSGMYLKIVEATEENALEVTKILEEVRSKTVTGVVSENQ